MTNGIGGPHGHKRAKKAAGKKERDKAAKASLKKKGWVPAALAKTRSE